MPSKIVRAVRTTAVRLTDRPVLAVFREGERARLGGAVELTVRSVSGTTLTVDPAGNNFEITVQKPKRK